MNKFIAPIFISIFSLALFYAETESLFSFGEFVNPYYSCRQIPQSSAPCYLVYDIYFMIFLAGVFIVSLTFLTFQIYFLMKNSMQKIFSIIVASLASLIGYVSLLVADSLCYYAGDTAKSEIGRNLLRNSCHEKYSNPWNLLGIFALFVVVYIVTSLVFSFVRKYRNPLI